MAIAKTDMTDISSNGVSYLVLTTILVGFVNIYVAYSYSEETWVDFKLFGVLGMTFVFMIAQGVYLAKHAEPMEDEASEDKT